DIFDTPPAAAPATAPLVTYAHHTHLSYEQRPDPGLSFRRGWQTTSTLRLVGVDVASKTFAGDVASARHLVRRYHLIYDASFHVWLLRSVELEGRCDGAEELAPAEGADQIVPTTACPRLPAMSFDYQHVLPFDSSGNPAARDLPGYEGFDERLRSLASSPDHS